MGVLIEPVRPLAGSVGKELLTRTDLNHYCTSYTQSHGRTDKWVRLGHHYGTGYSSNLRPAVYYTPNLDKEDNPQLGLSLLDPLSQTRRDFLPIQRPTRDQPVLRPAGRERESGYLQHRFLPPTVPMCLQTEYKGCFIPHRPPPSVQREHRLVGKKEESGFTAGEILQPNTFLPHYYPMDCARKMGRSIMKANFLPKVFLQASLLPHPGKGQKQRSIHHTGRFSGRMSSSGSSGFTHNAANLKTNTHPPPEAAEYFTHYHKTFCDVTAAEKLRSGWTRGGIHKNRASGYAGRDTDRFNLSG
ncbi:protein phosphatase 1 regulatory subunit 32 isoform X2 [Alosa sapidissima]|uniref:protein phosphatase 1 regulatory subunit 32 isoform X2 n=1 Tax=Alosa sapidissima TaxID=34773 RepID=UPI001C098DBD|nr:protein phosphatase 1 regulatory subunit 32 isoform X2 [Alosa sapidissima]